MNRPYFFTFAALFTGLLLSPVEGETGPTPVYSTSFEETEGYQQGRSVLNQNGWSIFSAHQHDAKIVSPTDGEVLSGNAMLRVTSGRPVIHRLLTPEPIEGSLTFTGLTSVDFQRGGEVASSFYLSGSRADEGSNDRFKGANFGIQEKDLRTRFFYRDGDDIHFLADDYEVGNRMAYRFECRMDLESGTWSLRIFGQDSIEPIAKVDHVRIRGKLKAIDYLMLQGSVGTSFDEMTITTP